ncbi:MAG: sodium:solute symporter family protein [Candidatus Kapabacteria bacterium]|nr:sodium:solute symporter family protein [Candidatus Kapabacteria bacterium]MDW8012170.1 sodium:solute symporter family protein [Bacteroidota bacterium]
MALEAVLVVLGYLVLNLVIGLWAAARQRSGVEEYFLAGRRLSPLVLFFTMVATNFSAFFFLGFAGAGYRIGLSYYAMMALGTALVGSTFLFVGYPAWRLGRELGAVTPAELVGIRMQSTALRVLCAVVWLLFTVPYIAIQPIGAGYLLSQLTDNAVPYYAGAVLLSALVVGYVFLGGMRSVAWTDVLQGLLMIGVSFAALWFVAARWGGIEQANALLLSRNPSFFGAQGAGGFFTLPVWISYSLLWLLSVPMFPQMFVRFLAARNLEGLRLTAVLYPVVTAFLFLAPVLIGLWGHLELPPLGERESDQVLPMLLGKIAPEWFAALVGVGALAAFMSTMDSQLLVLSSLLTRDIYAVLRPQASLREQAWVGRILVVVLAVAGLAIAWAPPATLFAIATHAFSGFAALFPVVVCSLYARRPYPRSCIAAVLAGEGLLAGFYTGLVQPEWFGGFLPVMPVVGVAAAVLFVGIAIERRRVEQTA